MMDPKAIGKHIISTLLFAHMMDPKAIGKTVLPSPKSCHPLGIGTGAMVTVPNRYIVVWIEKQV